MFEPLNTCIASGCPGGCLDFFRSKGFTLGVCCLNFGFEVEFEVNKIVDEFEISTFLRQSGCMPSYSYILRGVFGCPSWSIIKIRARSTYLLDDYIYLSIITNRGPSTRKIRSSSILQIRVICCQEHMDPCHLVGIWSVYRNLQLQQSSDEWGSKRRRLPLYQRISCA